MQTKPFVALALAIGALLPAAVYAQSVTRVTILPTPHIGPQHHPRAQRVMGMVTAAANGSYTVTPRRNPTPITFTLSPNARITQTAPGTLADVQTSDGVRVDGTVSADGSSIDATHITIMPTAPGPRMKSNAKHVVGTVSSLSPLKITEPDGTTMVAVNTTPTTRVTKVTQAAPSAITVNSRIAAMLTGPETARVARMVMILPSGRGGRRKAARL